MMIFQCITAGCHDCDRHTNAFIRGTLRSTNGATIKFSARVPHVNDLDTQIRLKAFSFLEVLSAQNGYALPLKILEAGFEFEGRRVPLVSPQGIFKPAILPQLPLSIKTVPNGHRWFHTF